MSPNRPVTPSATRTDQPIGADSTADDDRIHRAGARFQNLNPMPTWSHAVQLAPTPPTAE